MINTISGLKLEVISYDDDIIELQASASNNSFFASTSFYASYNEHLDFANFIEGFPRSIDESKEYEFGIPEFDGYGITNIKFNCKNGGGHILVCVTIQSFSEDINCSESATLFFETIPSEIDSFVKSLRKIKIEIGASAMLQTGFNT